ncbi:hypothetical protein BC834DRAFT_891146 [Gloeopeniophorella convolvens]|nr:hypothetical protein BC834DRAFT_891146 [Gloeopeniophorella convolvens]
MLAKLWKLSSPSPVTIRKEIASGCPVARLPPELVERIFIFLIVPKEPPFPAFSISYELDFRALWAPSQVCRAWRSATIAPMFFDRVKSNMPASAEKRALQAGACWPLHVELTAGMHVSLADRLRDGGHASRIASLRLSQFDSRPEVQLPPIVHQPLTALHTLIVDHSSDIIVPFPPSVFPSLHRLQLNRSRLDSAGIAELFPNLSHLELSTSAPLKEVLANLAMAPQLERLSLASYCRLCESPPTFDRVFLPMLVDLSIVSEGAVVCGALLESLIIPEDTRLSTSCTALPNDSSRWDDLRTLLKLIRTHLSLGGPLYRLSVHESDGPTYHVRAWATSGIEPVLDSQWRVQARADALSDTFVRLREEVSNVLNFSKVDVLALRTVRTITRAVVKPMVNVKRVRAWGDSFLQDVLDADEPLLFPSLEALEIVQGQRWYDPSITRQAGVTFSAFWLARAQSSSPIREVVFIDCSPLFVNEVMKSSREAAPNVVFTVQGGQLLTLQR